METRLEKHNIETLMLQGERVILINPADVRKKMRIVDRISRAVFGNTEYFEPLDTDEKHMEIRSLEDIESIVKKFS
jgi:hypothetical protein